MEQASSAALLLQAQGKLAEAEPLLRRALEGYEQQLGGWVLGIFFVFVSARLGGVVQARARRRSNRPSP